MKHGWNIIQSKKNVIMKVPGSKEGVARSSVLLGRNNDNKFTMLASKDLTPFQAFCFGVSHLTYME
jgi:hypothetical protein